MQSSRSKQMEKTTGMSRPGSRYNQQQHCARMTAKASLVVYIVFNRFVEPEGDARALRKI